MPKEMHSRTQIVENALGVKLPSDYALWLESEGYYNGEYYDVFGYIESFEDVEDYPCVIGSTKRYRDHPLLSSDDLMIHFDEFLNTLVVINCQDGCVYNVDFSYREKIAESFSVWFEKLKEIERKADMLEKRENMKILDFMLQIPNYTQDYLVRMAHHTTAIEGNTLTQEQTASILLDGFIFGGVSEREFYEVKNYKKILPFILQSLQENHSLTPSLIKEIHRLSMDNLIDNAGSFKTIPNLIIGADFETTKPYLVPTRIQEFCDNLNYKIQQCESKDEKLRAILKAHFDFERIHPFSDGNGRVGRLLIFYSCLQEDIIPPIIQKEDKARYISFLREENLEGFFELAKQMQKKEKEKMEIFALNQQ